MKNYFKRIFGFALGICCFLGMTSCNDQEIESSTNNNESSGTKEEQPSSPSTKPDLGNLAVHFYRYDGQYKDWALWLWQCPDGQGAEYQFSDVDDYGTYGVYELNKWPKFLSNGMGVIVKSKGSWNAKDLDKDLIIDFSKLEKDENNTYHVYLKTGDDTIYSKASDVKKIDILECKFASAKVINFVSSGEISNYKIYKNEDVIANEDVTSAETDFYYNFPEGTTVDLESNYKVELTFVSGAKLSKAVDISSLYQTKEFGDMFNYDGKDLGANYTKEETIFKVWAPTANSITLKVYNSGTPTSLSSNGNDVTFAEVTMEKGAKGVWSKTLAGDLEGKYYTYVVSNSKYTNQEIVDPYAKSTGINGLRGMIVDFSKTNPDGWDTYNRVTINPSSLTVYETHIADLTSSSTWGGTKANSKKFKGFYETGTTYTKDGLTVTTGFDHIKELGVNAVQLLPIFDQANDERAENAAFNWGYNPLNYNSLDGIYSSNPYDGYAKIKEFKELVKAYNEAGISIIMDVVYNHVASVTDQNFDVLVPGYYFRYSNGNLSNGSGCGNETASEMYMYRKFMIESTEFWAKEYHLDGFRFDLMGIHDIETMNQLTDNLHQNVSENIRVYGEPWSGGTIALVNGKPANQENLHLYGDYGQFNDQMRDALIAGGMKAATDTAWVTGTKTVSQGQIDTIKLGIKGITKAGVNDPLKSIQYVTCHDNYTLFDRIAACGISDYQTKVKMSMLANSVVFTSQGTTFMLAGEEFLRTKKGDHNSYQSSYQVNELDYSLKVKNNKIYENYKKLISLKQNASVFGKNETEIKADIEFMNNEDGSLIAYKIKDTVNNMEYIIAHSNGVTTKQKIVDFSGYTLYLDTLNESNLSLNANTSLKPYQTIIAYKQL